MFRRCPEGIKSRDQKNTQAMARVRTGDLADAQNALHGLWPRRGVDSFQLNSVRGGHRGQKTIHVHADAGMSINKHPNACRCTPMHVRRQKKQKFIHRQTHTRPSRAHTSM